MWNFLFCLLIFIGPEEQRYDQSEETGHKYEHWQVVRRNSVHKSWEHVVSPLDDGCFVVECQIGETRPRVVNLKSKDAKSLRRSELQRVNAVALMWQCSCDIGIQHLEGKLNICCFERQPLAFSLLVNGNEVLNGVLDEVVFRVNTLVIRAYFPVLDVAGSEHTWLLHGPINKLLAEALVGGTTGKRSEELVSAHRHAACEDGAMVTTGLIAGDERQLMSWGFTDGALIIDMTRLCRYLALEDGEDILIIRVQSQTDALESHLLLRGEDRLVSACERFKDIRRHQHLLSVVRIHGLSVKKLIVLQINYRHNKHLRMAHSRLQIGVLTIGGRHAYPHPRTLSSYGPQP